MGASAPPNLLQQNFDFTADHAVDVAQAVRRGGTGMTTAPTWRTDQARGKAVKSAMRSIVKSAAGSAATAARSCA